MMMEEPPRGNYRAIDWKAVCEEMAKLLRCIEAKEKIQCR